MTLELNQSTMRSQRRQHQRYGSESTKHERYDLNISMYMVDGHSEGARLSLGEPGVVYVYRSIRHRR